MIRKLKISENSIVYTAIFTIVFLTQFSYIQFEVIDWDESTYFLISKYVSEGSVLYVDYWEAKPPVFFIYLSIIFKIFGSTLLVGRIAGELLILLSTIFIYKILEKSYSKIISLSGALFLIYLFSYEASQPTMTEHLGIFFIVLSAYIVLRDKQELNFFQLGILFSLAFNTRNNLAFACLGIFIFLAIEKYLDLKKIYKLALGFFTPIFIISIYFIFHGSLRNYIYMLWEFPLQSTDSYRMSFNEFRTAFLNKLNLDQTFSLELIIFVVLLVVLMYFLKNMSQLRKSDLNILSILILLFLTISIIFGGRLFNHYLIQLFPFLAILFASGVNILKDIKYAGIIILSLTFLINLNLLVIGFNNILNYEKIESNYELKNISNFLTSQEIKGRDILVLENHIIYLYNDSIVPFKVVHPSNLPNTDRFNDILNSLTKLDLTFKDEFKLFVENQPEYIFCEDYCYSHIPIDYYEKYYTLIFSSEDYKLFKKDTR